MRGWAGCISPALNSGNGSLTSLLSPYCRAARQYVAMLGVLLQELPEIQVLLLDINCQFSRHLEKHFPDIAERVSKVPAGWLAACFCRCCKGGV